jgi:hypothetical protein
LPLGTETDSDDLDDTVTVVTATTSVVAAGAAGIGLIGLIVAIFVTAIGVVCCSCVVIFIWYRKFRVNKAPVNQPLDLERQTSSVALVNDLMTPAKDPIFEKMEIDPVEDLALPDDSQ